MFFLVLEKHILHLMLFFKQQTFLKCRTDDKFFDLKLLFCLKFYFVYFDLKLLFYLLI